MVFVCVLLIFNVYNNEEPSDDDHNDRVIPDVEVKETAEKRTASVEVEERAEFGPHLKLSRKEMAVDLFLDLFLGCCRVQACSNVPEVKYYFVGTVIVITTKCHAGHIFKFRG